MKSRSSFVDAFTITVLKSLKQLNVQNEKKQVINSDLIPKISEKITQNKLDKREIEFTKPVLVRRAMPRAPISPLRQMYPSITQTNRTIQAPKNTPVQPAKYPKIDPLLQDKTISSIECPGPNQSIIIIRSGQKQFTKITLTPEEIKKTLEDIAKEAKIPLIEGVFRAQLNDFSVNAVISGLIGSRFILKKQTPYSLLEQRQ